MPIKIFQIDAFASALFAGNPAAVCPLVNWLPDDVLQSIAAENNLSETAFLVPKHDDFEIRWFTPRTEVRLCGHATLASAHALMVHCGVTRNTVTFHSRQSGVLTVRKTDERYVLNFPADTFDDHQPEDALLSCLNHHPNQAFQGMTDLMLVFDTQQQIESLTPDMAKLKQVDVRGLIVTAPGDECDFVSRFFAPRAGIDEDPVTGSAHTSLIPFWSNQMNKTEMVAKQLSERGGTIYCQHLGDRVEIGGYAKSYLSGEILIPN